MLMKHSLIKLLTFRIVVLLLTTVTIGCSQKHSRLTNNSTHNSSSQNPSSHSASSQQNINPNRRQAIKQLDAFFQRWIGVPYAIGGLSRAGVDCSGWAKLAYANAFGKRLPRTTARQVTTGNWIARSNLQWGDLVFFKTGVKVRHVGIYIGNDQFMHASTSVGVTVSKLSNPYWHSRYWMARRHNF
ncbi:lipoprotein Spr/probable lipoprotein NlpC [Pleionea mediterranea]|uniref:Lipoprotein Spr/probable lipoprotein NlpC n=1 Tax=Pleionea mediterranea TaxID=523701 RepID=A0A316FWZ3_9GAMM|nr:lipoprotein Spr/probable lipoprotein NlpC [Pleionea mediterranea]